jgi:photosystem II stability/assembly factor-like uncharacterized protein
MNDEELITLVREQRDKVPLTIPVEEVIKRGRMQARHQRNRLVTMVTVVALVVGGTGAFVSSRIGTPPSRPSPNAVRGHVSPPRTAPGWHLVADINPAWQAVQAAGFEAGFSLVCPSTSTCYAENLPAPPGMQAEVEVTNDGGSTWKRSELPVTLSSPTRLACVDADTCAILGNDGAGNASFLETTDGGKSWTASPGPSDLTSWTGLTELSCTTAASCVALSFDPSGASAAAEAYTTDDGGDKWSESTLPPDFLPGALQCVWASKCVATGFFQSPDGSKTASAGRVLYSTDSGVTWATASLPKASLTTLGPFTRLSCADASDCMASFPGKDGAARRNVLVSSDGGESWSQPGASGLGDHFISGVSCPTALRCWASGIALPDESGASGPVVAREGMISSTSNGGKTWQNAQLPAGVGPVADISCPTVTSCYALAFAAPAAGGTARPLTSVLLAYGS